MRTMSQMANRVAWKVRNSVPPSSESKKGQVYKYGKATRRNTPRARPTVRGLERVLNTSHSPDHASAQQARRAHQQDQDDDDEGRGDVDAAGVRADVGTGQVLYDT